MILTETKFVPDNNKVGVIPFELKSQQQADHSILETENSEKLRDIIANNV